VKALTFRQLRNYWPVLLLLVPTFVLIAAFTYSPAISAIYHAFYEWNGDDIAEWAGIENFREALEDDMLAKAFGTVTILIVANLIKMIPSIITAVVIHRLYSERARYLYRVAFVVPMIIPGIVWLLIWRYFYDPTIGVLNKVLTGTYLMDVLNWLDTAMPAMAGFLAPINAEVVRPVFGSVWGLMLLGVVFLALMSGLRGALTGWMWWVGILVGGYLIWGPWRGAMLLACLAGLLLLSSTWRGRPGAGIAMKRIAAVLLLLGSALLALVLLLGCLGMSLRVWAAPQMPAAFLRRACQWLLVVIGAGIAVRLIACPRGPGIWRTSTQARNVLKWTGWIVIGLACVLVVLALTWTRPTKVFLHARPAWLSEEKLIVPALIFWGFPWVGVVSVLLYLSGLGNIDQSVYEAAEIDGCNWFRKFWNIELPLIMTQVRLNLVLMIIGTLRGWGLVFILLGDDGGPGGAGMLPGLLMFHKAFVNMRAGYACAIGLLLFLLIVYLTVINNKYVRVQR
jgi:ABC-type sugar transport system permease subunit